MILLTAIGWAIVLAIFNLIPTSILYLIFNQGSIKEPFWEIYFGLIASYAVLAMLFIS